MRLSIRGRRVVPLTLGAAMLAVVVAAALSPNLGAVPAQTNTQYTSQTSQGLSTWVIAAIAGVVIVAALALVLLLFMRRRRPPPAAAPVQPWEGGGAAPGGAPPAPPAPPPPPPAPPVALPAYLETPEDVGQAPPPVPPRPVVGAGAAGAAAAGAAAEEAEPDIDSLMAELDKISGEILKRAPKKGAAPPIEPAEEEPPH